MSRTLAATSIAFVLAFSPLALADQPSAQTAIASCQLTTPLIPVGQLGDGIPGGHRSTGPTFPISCMQPA
jgi:hypothetical protein